MPSDDTLFAAPRQVDASECHFYHLMDIPGHGLTTDGAWDLRGNEPAYLGGIDLAGKRVLEIGPASGYLSFYMESQGAEVVSVELAPDGLADLVPDVSLAADPQVEEHRGGMESIRNGYWFAHERVGSRAKVHYGDIYALPEELGHFDVAVICAVLLHVRDPLRVVEGCARLADSLVVTDVRHADLPDDQPLMSWFSTPENPVLHVWWKFSPQFFVRFAQMLGFTDNVVTFHEQLYVAEEQPRQGSFFTVVSSRPAG